MMTAKRRASATIAHFRPRRLAICIAQATHGHTELFRTAAQDPAVIGILGGVQYMKTFAEKVRTIVRKIPKGKTMTYKEVATKAGNPKAAEPPAR